MSGEDTISRSSGNASPLPQAATLNSKQHSQVISAQQSFRVQPLLEEGEAVGSVAGAQAVAAAMGSAQGVEYNLKYIQARRDESVKDVYHSVEIVDAYRW